MTPEEIARQEAIGAGISGSKEQQEAQQLYRQAKQETTIRESGAKSAKEKIARSLRDGGMTEDAIKDAVKDAKTEQERFQALNRLQRKETLKRTGTASDKRVTDQITRKARRDEEGGAKNDAAVAEDFDTFFSDSGPDPLITDKSNLDFLTPSQKREYKRFRSKAARGNVSDSDTRRIAKFQRDIETKRERTFNKSEAQKAENALTLASKKAQTAEDNAQISAIKANLSEIKSRLEDKNSKTKPSKDEKTSLSIRRQELMDALGSFVGGTPDPITDEQIKATIPDATPAEMVEIRAGLANGFTLEQMAAK
jgi:hypothetical protein